MAGGFTFKLRGVTVKDGEHFTAYIRKDQHWYFYCGMLEASCRKVNVVRGCGNPDIAIYTL